MTSSRQCPCKDTTCYNPCDSLCGHNELCIASFTVPATCECISGWSGTGCTINPNDCKAFPCQNGGTCIDGVDLYMCSCPPGWKGRHCEEQFDECLDGGCNPRTSKCIDQVNSFQCDCHSGFIPPNCLPQTTRPPTTTIPTTTIPTTVRPSQSRTTTTKDPKSGVTGTAKPEVIGESGEISEEDKILAIVIPPVGLILIIFIVLLSVYINLQRRRATNREENTTKAEKPVKMDKRRHSATPTAPQRPEMEKIYQRTDQAYLGLSEVTAVYGNEPLIRGMEAWYAYVLETQQVCNLTRVLIVRLDGEKWVLSPGCHVIMKEVENIYSVLGNGVGGTSLHIQRKEYGVVSNEDNVLVAHSIQAPNVAHEIACATKTRQFIVICTAAFATDHGACKEETRKLGDHIRKQGL